MSKKTTQKNVFKKIFTLKTLVILNFILTLATLGLTLYLSYHTYIQSAEFTATVNSTNSSRIYSVEGWVDCLKNGGDISSKDAKCIHAKIVDLSQSCNLNHGEKEDADRCQKSKELEKLAEELYGENWIPEKVWEKYDKY